MKNYLLYITILSFFLNLSTSSFSQEEWSLERCISYAKENNVEVIKQKIRNEILKSDIKIAKGRYLPDASFNASQNFSLGNSFNVSTGVGQLESSSNSFSLSSSVPIFDGFSNKYNLQKSKVSLEKGESDLERVRFDLSLNITNKYLQILFNKEILKVASEQVEISEQNYNRLKKLYDNALVGKRELLEIESTLASDQKEVIVAENNIKNSLIELKELLGVEQVENFDIEEIDLSSVPQELRSSSISENTINSNPIIKSSFFDLELKKRDLKISQASFYPKVNLSYSFSTNYFHILGRDDVVFNQDTGQFEENGFFTQLNNNRTHFISLSLTVPIFNRFQTKEGFKQAKEEIKISEIELANQKTLLKNSIKTAINDSNAVKATLESNKIAYQSQRNAFDILSKQYENGNITSFEFLQGKSKLIQNTSELIRSKYDYIFKNKILEFYFTLND